MDKWAVDSTWIELLDLKKWVNDTIHENVKDGEEGDNDDDEMHDNEAHNEDHDEERAQEIFQATSEDMALLKIASDNAMSITTEDAGRVFTLASLSGLYALDAHLLRDTLTSFASPSGEISPSGFLNFINEIMPSETAKRDAERDAVARALFQMYYVFEENGNIQNPSGLVDARALVAGLSILCKGSKSSKLGVGFSLYSEDGSSSGTLYIDDVRRLLESYLLSLQAMDIIPMSQQGSLAEPVASILALIMGDAVEMDLTFVSFGKWYNLTGYYSLDRAAESREVAKDCRVSAGDE